MLGSLVLVGSVTVERSVNYLETTLQTQEFLHQSSRHQGDC